MIAIQSKVAVVIILVFDLLARAFFIRIIFIIVEIFLVLHTHASVTGVSIFVFT